MTVSNFHMLSKGAGSFNGIGDDKPHDFTYVVADEERANFHAFFDEQETWINHRDNREALNVDADIVNKLLNKGDS